MRGQDEDGSGWIRSGNSSLRARSVESQLPAGRHALPENPVHLRLGDGELAARLRNVANRHYQRGELREALNQVVSTHYEEFRQLK